MDDVDRDIELVVGETSNVMVVRSMVTQTFVVTTLIVMMTASSILVQTSTSVMTILTVLIISLTTLTKILVVGDIYRELSR